LKVTYYEDKDILYLQVIPERPARVDETKYGFMVRYDWDDPDAIVGFECLDFSLFIPHLAEPGVLPKLDMTFDVEGAELRGASLKDVLIWAYRKYVLKQPILEAEIATAPAVQGRL